MYQFSICGPSHKMANYQNEDSLFCAELSPGRALVVAADGVSAAAQAFRGSRIATSAAAEMIRISSYPTSTGYIGGTIARAACVCAMSAAYNSILEEASSQRIEPEALGTTLMVAVFDERTSTLDYSYVGDGGIIAKYKDGSIGLLETPQRIDESGLTTTILNAPYWRFGRRDGVTAFGVCTDGVLSALCCDNITYRLNEFAEQLLASSELADAEIDGYMAEVSSLDSKPHSPMGTVIDDRTLALCWGCSKTEPATRVLSARAGA